MLIIFFLLAVIGLTLIVVESMFTQFFKEKLSRIVEEEEKNNEETSDKGEKKQSTKVKILNAVLYMSNCYQCSGLWSGLILGLCINPLSVGLLNSILLYSFSGTFISLLGAATLNYLDKIANSDQGSNDNQSPKVIQIMKDTLE